MMKKTHMVRRYLIFLVGLFFNAFGVAFVTKATLGTSPIAAIPYTLSLILTAMSMGTWTALYNILLVALQWAILRSRANKPELILQVVISFVFGSLVDVSMSVLHGLSPEHYVLKLIFLVIGCAIIAFGAYFEVVADVVMLPADGFVTAISKVSGKPYGTIRVISDCTQTVIAGALCLIFLRRLSGVREGTVIAALITGNMVKLFSRKFSSLTAFLVPQNN